MRFYLRTQQQLDQRYGPLHEFSVLHSDLVLLIYSEYPRWYHTKPEFRDWINAHGFLSVKDIVSLMAELRSRRRTIIEALLPENP